MHMLVDSMPSPLYFKTALELMVKPLTIPCKLTRFYILKACLDDFRFFSLTTNDSMKRSKLPCLLQCSLTMPTL